jgi:polyisoprenyl-phosphate glycosyltransferase
VTGAHHVDTPPVSEAETALGASVPELSIVVPVFNEEGNIEEYLRRTVPILEACVESYEIIFVLDPSTDRSEQIISEASQVNSAVKLVLLSRRFGQPTATIAGIELAAGRAAIVMDVDLQDPPELIVEMVDKWRDGSHVVYAQRRERTGETLVKRTVATVGYRVINRFSEVPIPKDTGDFRLLDRTVIEHLRQFPETHGFLRGLVALVGFEQAAVPFDRPARFAGKGNYNRFVGSLRIGFNGLIAFSSALLNLSTLAGFVAAGLSFLSAIVYVVLKIAGVDFPIGSATIVTAVMFVGGVQLICLGIIGQYIGRIYDEVKRRPRFIVARSVGLQVDASGMRHG